jgi:hypothetical protein
MSWLAGVETDFRFEILEEEFREGVYTYFHRK